MREFGSRTFFCLSCVQCVCECVKEEAGNERGYDAGDDDEDHDCDERETTATTHLPASNVNLVGSDPYRRNAVSGQKTSFNLEFETSHK